MSLVVSKEGKHISKINYLPQPQLRKSFPFFAPSQARCYTWPLWWQWSLSFGFYQVVTRKLKWYSVLYSTGSYRVSTCNYSRGSQYVVEDYFLVLTRWLFAARSDISPLHVYLIRSFVSRLNPTFLIKPGFHQNSFPFPQESGLKQPTLCINNVWINTLAMSYFLPFFGKFDLAGPKRYVVSWFIACLLFF